jgi:hypothetical protein
VLCLWYRDFHDATGREDVSTDESASLAMPASSSGSGALNRKSRQQGQGSGGDNSKGNVKRGGSPGAWRGRKGRSSRGVDVMDGTRQQRTVEGGVWRARSVDNKAKANKSHLSTSLPLDKAILDERAVDPTAAGSAAVTAKSAAAAGGGRVFLGDRVGKVGGAGSRRPRSADMRNIRSGAK